MPETGAAQDLSAQFFDAAKEALSSVGKELNSNEEYELRQFIKRGAKRLEESDSYDYLMQVEKNLRTKLTQVATAQMSLKEILRKLCPMDPFC
jgi:hypothetical protein